MKTSLRDGVLFCRYSIVSTPAVRRFRLAGVVASLSLIVSLVLHASDSVVAQPERKTIVILGDSLAAGFGLDPSEAYPALLQKKVDEAGLKFSIINAGVSGDTSAG